MFTAARIIARKPKMLDVSKILFEDPARAAIIAGDIVVHDYMSDNSCPL